MIYVTSDQHFNHDRSFIYSRLNYTSIDQANKDLIRKWNSVVKADDEVYVVGDFFLGPNCLVNVMLDQLNGKIHLIIGNHDTEEKIKIYRKHPKIVSIEAACYLTYKGRRFFMSHYRAETADLRSDPKHAIYNLFGHSHEPKLFYDDKPYQYNVQVDAHSGYPVSMDQVMKDIDNEIKICCSYLI